ncbi:MAG: PaaI family thioesterase [Pseudomonadales bacterium]|nr:PaaI family thioesterase [Pseudomonadales bacterium]
MNDTVKEVKHPFAELLGFEVASRGEGQCTTTLAISPHHLNPNGVVHGAVLYALADTGMGGALTSLLAPDQICSTIEIKINYFRPGTSGSLSCKTRVVHKGARTAAMDSEIFDSESRLIARATGTFMILARPA